MTDLAPHDLVEMKKIGHYAALIANVGIIAKPWLKFRGQCGTYTFDTGMLE